MRDGGDSRLVVNWASWVSSGLSNQDTQLYFLISVERRKRNNKDKDKGN